MSAQDTCCFCLEKIDNQTYTEINCCHKFHKKCLNQYFGSSNFTNKKCPLCRTIITTKNDFYIKTDIPLYNDEDFVWIFGFWKRSTSKGFSNNELIVKNANLTSGCLWSLYDKKIMNTIEDSLLCNDSEAEFGIGTVNYKIVFGDNLISNVEDDEFYACIQESTNAQYKKTRPVLRIRYGEMLKRQIVTSQDDNLFYDEYKIIKKGDKIQIINLSEQNKSVSQLEEEYNEKIQIMTLKELKTYC
jgi:hypothetical protein